MQIVALAMRDATFSIYMADVSPTAEKIWYIICVDGEDPEEDEDLDFFFALPFSNHRLAPFPRLNGWLRYATDAPLETAPSLTYNFDDYKEMTIIVY